MVSLHTAYSTATYANLAASLAAGKTGTTKPTMATPASTAPTNSATSVTLSDAAKAALETSDLPTLLAAARDKLTALLTAADRTSPLEDDKLALDLSSLDARELYGIANSHDDSFSDAEKKAAGLEMQRRFDAALGGPAAIAKVTGKYDGLYKAAADYLDSMGPEERADPKSISARAALTEGLKQLAADPKTLPDTGEDDPVALYLALAEAGQTTGDRPIAAIGDDMRSALDKKYADAIANGKVATFNKATTTGTYIDLATFDARSLAAMVLNTNAQFSPAESRAADNALRAKSSAALVAGYKDAAKSQDPTALSQNMIGLYSSMSVEERQALGWSDTFYQTALASYTTTAKLTQLFAQAGGDSTGLMSWLGK